MSLTGGQGFGAVIGAAVGFVLAPVTGGASLAAALPYIAAGATIGMFAGGIIDPPPQQTVRQEGSRLGDLTVQTSEWGRPIRRLFGTYKLSGNIIWSLDLHETKHVEESGEGKGGGGTKTETTWYSYAGSWACGFCEGEILSINKIWFDSVLVYNGTNYAGGLTADNHTRYLGTNSQIVDWYMQQSSSDTPAYRNLVYIVFRGIELENYGNKIPNVSIEATKSTPTTVGSISESLLLRAGLEPNDFDISNGTDTVNGYVVSNPMDTRSAIGPVISAYNFELIEANSKLILKKRDAVSIDTIEENEIVDFVEITRLQTVELSKQINIMYSNKDNNYSAGLQMSVRNDSNTENSKTYQFPLALSDDKAKEISERFLFTEWNERVEFKFNTTSNHLDLLPSDVVTLNYENDVYTIRLTKVDYLTDKSVNIEASLEQSDIYISNAKGSDTGSVDYTIYDKGVTSLILLDIPMLDNSVNYEGIYLAVESSTLNWTGCSIHKSIDDETTYNKVLDMYSESVIGVTTTVLADGNSYVWDYNEVTVESNKALYEVTKEVALQGTNYVLIGDEILQYTSAVDNLDGTYTLSGLLRGRRGTEWAMNTHAISERFVFLSNALSFDRTAYLNVESYYKSTSFGSFVEDSVAEYIAPEIRCLKPLSVSYVRGSRDISNNLTITWMRRSRDVTGYFNTLTLMEEQELYEIDVLGTGDVVLDTKYIQDAQSYVYSDADQSTDNGSHVSGDPIKINIYQISGVVLRGYVTQEIL